jgi:hypothetical protein
MRLRLLLIAVFLGIAPMAFAGNSSLNDWCFYVNTLDLNRSCNDGAGANNFNPPTVTSTTFDYHLGDNGGAGSGLGTVVVTLGAGSYNIFAIFNYDINSLGDPLESASAHGSIPVGQVYSVDAEGNAPHYSGGTGSLYTQFSTGTLDSTNHCDTGCSDVAVSLGVQNLTVPDGKTGTVTFTVSNTPPPSGFYVQQTDGSGNDLFFTQTAAISNPEPGTVMLLSGGIALMLLGLRRKKKA